MRAYSVTIKNDPSALCNGSVYHTFVVLAESIEECIVTSQEVVLQMADMMVGLSIPAIARTSLRVADIKEKGEVIKSVVTICGQESMEERVREFAKKIADKIKADSD